MGDRHEIVESTSSSEPRRASIFVRDRAFDRVGKRRASVDGRVERHERLSLVAVLGVLPQRRQAHGQRPSLRRNDGEQSFVGAT
jgi:hypothetical protein